MEKWIDVASLDDLPPGQRLLAAPEGIQIAVFNLDQELYAIANVCTHDAGPLDEADWEGGEVICPRHGARFSIRTGEVLAPPAYEDLETFEVRVEGGRIQVRIDD